MNANFCLRFADCRKRKAQSPSRGDEWYLQNLGTRERYNRSRNLDSLYIAFISVWSLACFGLGLGFAKKGLSVSATLGFYHTSPLPKVAEAITLEFNGVKRSVDVTPKIKYVHLLKDRSKSMNLVIFTNVVLPKVTISCKLFISSFVNVHTTFFHVELESREAFNTSLHRAGDPDSYTCLPAFFIFIFRFTVISSIQFH